MCCQVFSCCNLQELQPTVCQFVHLSCVRGQDHRQGSIYNIFQRNPKNLLDLYAQRFSKYRFYCQYKLYDVKKYVALVFFEKIRKNYINENQILKCFCRSLTILYSIMKKILSLDATVCRVIFARCIFTPLTHTNFFAHLHPFLYSPTNAQYYIPPLTSSIKFSH